MNEKISIESHGGQRENTFFINGDKQSKRVFVFSDSYFIYLKSKEEENKFLFFKNTKSKEQRSSASDSLRQLLSSWCSSR